MLRNHLGFQSISNRLFTYTGCPVLPGYQSIGAGAYVATLYVGAFPSIANSWILFAFVDVHARSTVEIQREPGAVSKRKGSVLKFPRGSFDFRFFNYFY